MLSNQFPNGGKAAVSEANMNNALVLVLTQLIGVAEEMKRQNGAHPSLGLTTQISDVCTIIADVTYKITEDLRKTPSLTLCPEYSITRGEKDAYLAKRSGMDSHYDDAKIPLIKDIRARTGLGLKEAKDLADKWIAEKVYYSSIYNKYLDRD
jgi:hypothetical protein